MSTWQIYSDAGNTFRWEVSSEIPNLQHQQKQQHSSCPPLPSMKDLLLQGCSKLVETSEAPLFSTGLGKSVVVKASSVAKAKSVIGDEETRDNANGFSNSIFCTASGKSVSISTAGLVKAKSLLGLEEENGHFTPQSFQPATISSPGSENSRWCNASDNRRVSETMSVVSSAPIPSSMPGFPGGRLLNEVNPNQLQPETHNITPKPPSIKFQTAGGRSLSVSSDALERARRLLSDPDMESFLNEEKAIEPTVSTSGGGTPDNAYRKGTKSFPSFTYPVATKRKHLSKDFLSPLRTSSNQDQSSLHLNNIISGNSLIQKFDAADGDDACGSNRTILSSSHCSHDTAALTNGVATNCNTTVRLSRGPLTDISNTFCIVYRNNKEASKNNSFRRGNSVSPFKRPRSSKFITPLNRSVSIVPSGLSTVSYGHSSKRQTVCTRYPFQIPRVYIKKYFGVPPSYKSKLAHSTEQKRITVSEVAENYTFPEESDHIGSEAFGNILVQCGASPKFASKEWVSNHYKLIFWKLASYDKCYPIKPSAGFLTFSNVLEELKYRYEREVNHGHRSAIKRILEGDASPSSMMILCISAIHMSGETETQTPSLTLNGVESTNTAKVELTDGWYLMDAILDVSLSKKLATGKLFVGQKIRIWGAGLCGWAGPVSPLEASRAVNLLLHINGTYRAHWDDRLGFCKGIGVPLAFRCIKSDGGPIPQTLIGVTRIYPLLYKEKLCTGGSVVRSERMETKMILLHKQRRSVLVEDIVSEFERESKAYFHNESDSEGAKILKMLETAAEPEVLMAEMSHDQLASFASYQAKVEVTKQLDMEKAIEKALQDAGLGERVVTPFMRVRVVGLTKTKANSPPKEGLITIWNPTKKQQSELVEGKAYVVSGLIPMNSDSGTLYLQARGTTTEWQPLSFTAMQHFQPFSKTRVSTSVSDLGGIPFSSEFDMAAYVVHVGEVFTAAEQKKQWIFVTDSSSFCSQSDQPLDALLAISFSSPIMDSDSFSLISSNLAGSVVGFSNLIRRPKDQINQLWIAEATENSTFFLSGFDSPNHSHLKNAADATQSWAKSSTLIIKKLKEKVLFIIGDSKG